VIYKLIILIIIIPEN
jgi:hypothetical protein